MGESNQRWQSRIWIGTKIDQPVTLFGVSLENLQLVVRQWLQEQQPGFFSTASPAHQGLRRYSYVHSNDASDGTSPEWRWLNDRDGPFCLRSFEQVIRHFLAHMIVEHGPGYDKQAEWRRLHLHQVRSLRREVCKTETDWLHLEDDLQDGWCILRGRLVGSNEREGVQRTSTTLLLGHPNPAADQIAVSHTLGESEGEEW